MRWLDRLKNQQHPETDATKPTKLGFVGFVAHTLAPIEKIETESTAANDTTPDPDRWCWPYSTTMTGREIDTFKARLSQFTDKGVTTYDGDRLADRLVMRDRENDDRRLCLECLHLSGYGHQSWRCGAWQAAGVAVHAQDGQVAPDLVLQLQRCDGFSSTIAQTSTEG